MAACAGGRPRSGARTPESGLQRPRNDKRHTLPPHPPESPARARPSRQAAPAPGGQCPRAAPHAARGRRFLLSRSTFRGPLHITTTRTSLFSCCLPLLSTRVTPFNTEDARTSVSTRLDSRLLRGTDAATRAGPGLRGAARGASSRTPDPGRRGRVDRPASSAGPRDTARQGPQRTASLQRGRRSPRTGGRARPTPHVPLGLVWPDPQCGCPPGPCCLSGHTHSVCHPRHKCFLREALRASLLGPLLTQNSRRSARTSHHVRLPLRGLCVCLALDWKAFLTSDSKNHFQHFFHLSMFRADTLNLLKFTFLNDSFAGM